MKAERRGFSERATAGDALKIVLEKVKVLGMGEVTLEDSFNRVLGKDLLAERDNPPYDRSAMDGYAVRGKDTFGASQGNPIYLKLKGAVSIGVRADIEVNKGEAVKVVTGAETPVGSDAVVMQEYAREIEDRIEVVRAVPPGKNVSQKGEDFKRGEVILKKGRVLRGQDSGIIAANGMAKINVYKQPEVAIISTGDELVVPGEEIGGSKIYDANSYMLSSLVSGAGGLPLSMGIVKDDYKEIKKRVLDSLGSDLVLISGATSVGEKDVIPELVGEIGEVHFHGVAVRPGEPTGFGSIKGVPVFMLPGYPVASFVGFELFARPALQKMAGMGQDACPYTRIEAKLKRKIASQMGRLDFVRVRVEEKDGEMFVEPIMLSGSGVLSSLVKADGFVLVPEEKEGIEEGEWVTVALL